MVSQYRHGTERNAFGRQLYQRLRVQINKITISDLFIVFITLKKLNKIPWILKEYKKLLLSMYTLLLIRIADFLENCIGTTTIVYQDEFSWEANRQGVHFTICHKLKLRNVNENKNNKNWFIEVNKSPKFGENPPKWRSFVGCVRN